MEGRRGELEGRQGRVEGQTGESWRADSGGTLTLIRVHMRTKHTHTHTCNIPTAHILMVHHLHQPDLPEGPLGVGIVGKGFGELLYGHALAHHGVHRRATDQQGERGRGELSVSCFKGDKPFSLPSEPSLKDTTMVMWCGKYHSTLVDGCLKSRVVNH